MEEPVTNPGVVSPLVRDSNIISNTRSFEFGASIVLVGLPGVGKSSLAVIAASFLRYKAIDVEYCFTRATGKSPPVYREEFGVKQYLQRDLEVLRSVLCENGSRHVIICGPTVLDPEGTSLIKQFAFRHPVILITRDPQDVRGRWDGSAATTRRMWESATRAYRQCINYEFVNVNETNNSDRQPRSRNIGEQSITAITLKHTRVAFERFLDSILQLSTPALTRQHMLPLDAHERPYTNVTAVPITSVRFELFEKLKLETGTDAVEFIVEFDAKQEIATTVADSLGLAIATLRRHTMLPIIVHLTPGLYRWYFESSLPTFRYLDLLHLALRYAPSYMTLNLDLPDKEIHKICQAKGPCTLIADIHEASPGHAGWRSELKKGYYQKAQRLGIKVIRITQPAVSFEDNFGSLSFQNQLQTLPGPELRVIAYNTGRLGRISQLYNRTFAPVAQDSSTNAPGMPDITSKDIQAALFQSQAYDSLKFYIVGSSVDYSFSPHMQNAAFRTCGIPHEYKILQTPKINEIAVIARGDTFGGASISLPFKIDAIGLLDVLSPSAEIIGAINTLLPVRESLAKSPLDPRAKAYRNRAGAVSYLYGDNTDWIGIKNTISKYLSPANAVNGFTSAFVLGAGGMARASIYALAQLGVKTVFVYNRTQTKVDLLKEKFGKSSESPEGLIDVRVVQNLSGIWPAEYKLPTIIINTVPAHCINDVPPPNYVLPELWLASPTGGVFVELSYKTPSTALERQIQSAKYPLWTAANPMEVLTEQGFAQFELFTGINAPRKIMADVVWDRYYSMLAVGNENTEDNSGSIGSSSDALSKSA